MNLEEILRREGLFIIGEIGSNHNGDFDSAGRLVEAIANAGGNAAKLQLFRAEDLVSPDHPQFELLRTLEVSMEWFLSLRTLAKTFGIELIASAFNEEYFEFLESQSVLCHKLASSEATNLKTLHTYSKSNIPLLVSLGMTEWFEVETAIKILTSDGKQDIYLLHCVSSYPLEIEDANLSIIAKLRNRYEFQVGFSDHTMSTQSGAWAYLLGARVFEKHITLHRSQVGPDHNYALEPKEFEEFVANIRNAKLSLGTGEKSYSASELEGRHRFGTYAIKNLEMGAPLGPNDIEFKRPRLGIPSNLAPSLYGKVLRINKVSGEPINLEDLS